MIATFLGNTSVAGVLKHRWECPNCRAKANPECRFNLSPKRDGGKYKCRFCGIGLELIR